MHWSTTRITSKYMLISRLPKKGVVAPRLIRLRKLALSVDIAHIGSPGSTVGPIDIRFVANAVRRCSRGAGWPPKNVFPTSVGKVARGSK